MNVVILIFIVLLVIKMGIEIWLNILNRNETLKHANKIPTSFAEMMNGETYHQSVEYTLAKNQLDIFSIIYNALILAIVILSGFLPFFFEVVTDWLGMSAWAQGMYLFLTGIIIYLTSIPVQWWVTFHLEARFDFNTTTPKIWLMDQLRGLLLGLILVYPLFCLLLKLVDWIGALWWLWAFGIVFLYQLIMLVITPKFILPLFYKLTPLPEGELKNRLLNLANHAGFKAKTIQVMDGSKRSKHSNAFFTGFGRWRKIVLFDTLIEQLQPDELEAVLAHEIGHYKKGHVPKMLVLFTIQLLIGFAVIAYLANQSWFYDAFGFSLQQGLTPAFLLFTLLSGLISFWLTPVFNAISRKHEYEADAFARKAISATEPMIRALRKLSEKNLSNLTPHPLFSKFYYSHPTLLERETALKMN